MVKDDGLGYVLADSKDKVLIFGGRQSASVHLIAHLFAHIEKQAFMEKLFTAELRYPDADGKTAYSLREGTV